jgi:hypothetical protein
MMGQIFNAMRSKNSSAKARHVAMVAQGAWEGEMAFVMVHSKGVGKKISSWDQHVVQGTFYVVGR